jgi:hypothetical protein
MSRWREVQEALYQRFVDQWVEAAEPLTPVQLENEQGFDPPNGQWVKLLVVSRPGGPGTIGRPGNRKMDRAGAVFMLLREPPGGGVGSLSDLAERARDVYENCRFNPHDIRFAQGDIGREALVEDGRWWGVTVECRFDYEDLK